MGDWIEITLVALFALLAYILVGIFALVVTCAPIAAIAWAVVYVVNHAK